MLSLAACGDGRPPCMCRDEPGTWLWLWRDACWLHKHGVLPLRTPNSLARCLLLCAGDWLHEHTDLRDVVARHDLGLEDYEQVTRTLMTRIQQSGRSHPQPRRSSRADDPPLYSTSAPLNPLKDLGIGLEEPHMQQPVVV